MSTERMSDAEFRDRFYDISGCPDALYDEARRARSEEARLRDEALRTEVEYQAALKSQDIEIARLQKLVGELEKPRSGPNYAPIGIDHKLISEEELKEMEWLVERISPPPWDGSADLFGEAAGQIEYMLHVAPEAAGGPAANVAFMTASRDWLPRLIADVRRLKDALGMYGMPVCWRDVFQHGVGYSAFTPPHPDYRNEPGWVLARKALGWSEPSEPCENPSCDGYKDEETYGGAHRCFKDGRWLDDGSEM